MSMLNADMKSIRVMIVEDSPTISRHLESVINRDRRLHVVACAASGEEALQLLHRKRPDVISLDIRLPGMDGFEFTRRVMSEAPTPIVVCSANVECNELRITMNALRAGALAVVEKPVGETHADYELLAGRICNQLVSMSGVKVIRQRALLKERPMPAPLGEFLPLAPADGVVRLVGMVASTGGPNALATILGALPPDFPVPIALVQHITPAFSDGFIDWLGSVCPLNVIKAATGLQPQPGCVYVAPADLHLRVRPHGLELWDGPLECLQRPSGNVLLASIADTLGGDAIGIVLTGMGEDGASGLRAMRSAGAYTIAEDRSTAVVYGMPRAAEQFDAACEFLPLYDISRRMIQRVAVGEEVVP